MGRSNPHPQKSAQQLGYLRSLPCASDQTGTCTTSRSDIFIDPEFADGGHVDVCRSSWTHGRSTAAVHAADACLEVEAQHDAMAMALRRQLHAAQALGGPWAHGDMSLLARALVHESFEPCAVCCTLENLALCKQVPGVQGAALALELADRVEGPCAERAATAALRCVAAGVSAWCMRAPGGLGLGPELHCALGVAGRLAAVPDHVKSGVGCDEKLIWTLQQCISDIQHTGFL